MKTIRLFIIAFWVMSTWALAAEPQALSLSQQQNVNQLSQEMSARGVSEEQAERMFSLMHQNTYDEQNILRAKQTVLNAAEEGLPTAPVMNKAMEGMAKQVPQEEVLAAMETVRNRYSYSYRLARSLSDDKKNNGIMAEAIAGSLAAGMANQDMDMVLDSLKLQTRQQTRNQADSLSLQTMLTVRSMMRLGATPADTSGIVSQALKHRYTAQNMEQLRNRFTDQAQNTPAKQLASQYARSLGTGSGAGGNGSGGNGSGGNGSGGNGSGGNGSGGNGSGGNGSGSGNGSGGNGSGGNGSGGNGGGGNGGGKG